MNAQKINIAIVAGGDSGEYEVSLKSLAGLQSFLQSDAFEITPVIIRAHSWLAKTAEGDCPIDKNDFSFLKKDGSRYLFHFAYITIHGTPGENGMLPAYFELIGLPHSTCNAFVGAFTFNKYFCNRFFSNLGFYVADAILLRKGDDYNPNEVGKRLGWPLFVKPNNGGSSVKNKKVHSIDELPEAVEDAMSEGGEVLLESLLKGTELTCGCYRDAEGIHALPITEVVSHNEFFDYDAKYNGDVEEITPARISEDKYREIQEATCRIYRTLNARGIIRIDYFLSPDSTVYLVEVNTTPGMTSTSFIPQQIAAAGLDIKVLMQNMVKYLISSS